MQNNIFEKANPDFCDQFIHDMEKRKEKDVERSNRAKAMRLKGNRSVMCRCENGLFRVLLRVVLRQRIPQCSPLTFR